MATRIEENPTERGVKLRLALAQGQPVIEPIPACAGCGLPVSRGGVCSNCNRSGIALWSGPAPMEPPAALDALCRFVGVMSAVGLCGLFALIPLAVLADLSVLGLLVLLPLMAAGCLLARRGHPMGWSLWTFASAGGLLLGLCSPETAGLLLLLAAPSLWYLLQPGIRDLYLRDGAGVARDPLLWLAASRQLLIGTLGLAGLLLASPGNLLAAAAGTLGIAYAALNGSWYAGALSGSESSARSLSTVSRLESGLAFALAFPALLILSVTLEGPAVTIFFLLLGVGGLAGGHSLVFSEAARTVSPSVPVGTELLGFRFLSLVLAAALVLAGALLDPGWTMFRFAFGPGAFLAYLALRSGLGRLSGRTSPVDWRTVSSITALEVLVWTLLFDLMLGRPEASWLVTLLTRSCLLPSLALVFWLGVRPGRTELSAVDEGEPRSASRQVAEFMRRRIAGRNTARGAGRSRE